MFLKNKLNKLTHYIKNEYTRLNLKNVSITYSNVGNICNIVSKEKNCKCFINCFIYYLNVLNDLKV